MTTRTVPALCCSLLGALLASACGSGHGTSSQRDASVDAATGGSGGSGTGGVTGSGGASATGGRGAGGVAVSSGGVGGTAGVGAGGSAAGGSAAGGAGGEGIFVTLDGYPTVFDILSASVSDTLIDILGNNIDADVSIEIALSGTPAAGTVYRCGTTLPSAAVLVSETVRDLLTKDDCEVDLQTFGDVGTLVSGTITATLLGGVASATTPLVGTFQFIRR